MRSRHISVGVAVTGAATAVLTLAAPAPAVSPNFSLTTGGSSAAGTVSYTASIRGSNPAVLKDLVSGVQLTCTVASASGTVKRGLNQTGPNIGAITSTQFGTALAPAAVGGTPMYGSNPCLGNTQPIAVKQTGTWNINATAFSSANPVPAPSSVQTTAGAITNIAATVYVRNTCIFNVVGVSGASTGTAAGSYANAFSTLNVASADTVASATLQVANVRLFNGSPYCLAGTISNGDRLSFTGGYNVEPVPPATGQLWVRT